METDRKPWERITTMRLDDETLEALDVIAADLAGKVGGRPNRAAAVRFAAREAAKKILKKSAKTS